MRKLNMTAIMNKEFNTAEPVDDSENFWVIETSDFPTQKEAWEIVFKSISSAIENEANSWLLRKSFNLFEILTKGYTYSPSSTAFIVPNSLENLFTREEIRDRLVERSAYDDDVFVNNPQLFSSERVLGADVIHTDSEDPTLVWANDFYPIFKCSLREALAFTMVTTNVFHLYSAKDHVMKARYGTVRGCVWDNEKQKFVRLHNLMEDLKSESTSIAFPLLTCKVLLTMLADSSCIKKLKADVQNQSFYVNFRTLWTHLHIISGLGYSGSRITQVMKRWASFVYEAESLCMTEIKSRNPHPPEQEIEKSAFANINFDGVDSPEMIAKSMLSSGLGANSLSIFGEHEILFGDSHNSLWGRHLFFTISNDITYEFCKQALKCKKTANFKYLAVKETVASLGLKQASGKELAKFIKDNNLSDTIKTLRVLKCIAPLISNLEEFNSIMFQWQFDEDTKIQELVSSFDATIKQRQLNEESATMARHAENDRIFAESVYPLWQGALRYAQMHSTAAKCLYARVSSLGEYFDNIDGN